ncbi:MAG: LysR family transcriptional regulator [Polyangiaceae bacterium]
MGARIPWDLLRAFEAVLRLGSLSAAARDLGVSQSTMSRQMAQLEGVAGVPLLTRGPPARPTERGMLLLSSAERMLEASVAADAALDDAARTQGDVTLATVGEIARWVLAKEIPRLLRAHPGLRLHVVVDNRVRSLAAGEADLSLRMARPARGDLVARSVHVERYAYFASRRLPLGPGAPWIGLTGSLGHLPEQRHAERTFRGRAPRVSLEDVEALAYAVEAGVGVAVLPRGLAARLDDVVEVDPAAAGGELHGALPARDFWLVVHRTKRRVPKVRAVIDWLASIPSFDRSTARDEGRGNRVRGLGP